MVIGGIYPLNPPPQKESIEGVTRIIPFTSI